MRVNSISGAKPVRRSRSNPCLTPFLSVAETE
jgi:hypothetical protein